MFAIEVEYLLGRAVATDPHNRDRAEWPPHPARLYSALVDAHGAAPTAAGEAALRWLEAQPAPALCVDWGDSVSLRQVVKHFVPANDEVQSKGARRAPLVDRRERKERYFPAAVPTRSTVRFIWSVDAGEHLTALQSLTAELVYLGHSSSLIAARVRDDAAEPDLVPDAEGDLRLRVPAPGRLDRLVQVHDARRHNTLVQPPYGRDHAYRVRDTVAVGPHGPAEILAIEGGPRVSIEQLALLTPGLRAAILSLWSRDIPSVISGHTEDRQPLQAAHLALCALANVGFRHADGSIKGFACLLPRGVDSGIRLHLRAVLAQLRELKLGRLGVLQLAPRAVPDLDSLRLGRYTRPSTEWHSVTPVVLSRHPKPRRGESAADMVARELANLGLPAAKYIECSAASAVRAVPSAAPRGPGAAADAFVRPDLKQLQGRQWTHVRVQFERAVRGPLVIGAGRHLGLGMLLATETADGT